MSGISPSEDRLRDLEQGVLTRIRRRAAVRARIASAAVATALVVGAVVLVPPALGTLSTRGGSAAGGSGGGSAASTAEKGPASAVRSIRCHLGDAASAAPKLVPLPARPSAGTVAAACAAAATRPGSTPAPASFVACRDAGGTWEVFPDDGHRATLCARHGLDDG